VSTLLREQRVPPGRYFKPNSTPQYRFFVSEAPEVLYSSMYGRGKSRVLCEKAHYTCLRYPGAQVVLARKRRDDMGTTTLHTLLNEVIDPAQRDWGWRVSADGGSQLLYPNGSRIVVVGLDRPSKLRSGAYLRAYFDQCEEAEEEEWNAIGGRLRQWRDEWREYDWTLGMWVEPTHQLGGACNPESPEHFLYRLFDPDKGSHRQYSEADEELPNGDVVPAGSLLREVVLSSISDNVENLHPRYLQRLNQMRGRYRERYVLGKWSRFEGLIYDCYEPDVSIIDRPAAWAAWGGFPPPDWPRYRAIDFGYQHPFVCQWWAEDRSEDTFYRYREIYHTRRLVSAHREQILQLEADERAVIEAAAKRLRDVGEEVPNVEDTLYFDLTFTDHDAEDRATLEETGVIVTQAANKAVSLGLQRVYELLQPYQRDGEEVWRSHIYLIRGALVERDPSREAQSLTTCTEEELMRYRYQKARVGVSGEGEREEPYKRDDDGCDAMRYLFCTLPDMYGEMRVVRL
jgi:hypothetical protein